VPGQPVHRASAWRLTRRQPLTCWTRRRPPARLIRIVHFGDWGRWTDGDPRRRGRPGAAGGWPRERAVAMTSDVLDQTIDLETEGVASSARGRCW